MTDSFKINSGNNATKRKKEDALTNNFKLKMNPYALDLNKPLSPLSPKEPKRRVLGEIQNSIFQSPLKLKNSPISQKTFSSNVSNLLSPKLKSPIAIFSSPNSMKSKVQYSPKPCTSKTEKPHSLKRDSRISKIFEERTNFKMNKENTEPVLSETFINIDVDDARDCSFSGSYEKEKLGATKLDFTDTIKESLSDTLVPGSNLEPEEDVAVLQDLEAEFEADNFDMCTKYEIISTDSPDIISRGRTSSSRKVNQRNFQFGAPISETESSTSFNKPNASATRMLSFEDSPVIKRNTLSVKKSLKFNETPTKMYLRDCGGSPGDLEEQFTMLGRSPKKDSTDIDLERNPKRPKLVVDDSSFDEGMQEASQSIHEAGSEAGCIKDDDISEEMKPQCSNIFGLGDECVINISDCDLKRIENEENAINFNETPTKSKYNLKKTALSFSGVFRSPQSPKVFGLSQNEATNSQQDYSLFKPKTPIRLRHERSDSSIGSMSSTPCKVRFPSESVSSMESGFISELEEPFLEIEETNSPKISNFNELLSGQIKNDILCQRKVQTVKHPLHNISRSLSFNVEKSNPLFPITESPERRNNKRTENTEEVSNKRRKSNCGSSEARPVLHRAHSENNASIMSALARSVADPDLIGDFTQPFALPFIAGHHPDLKSISSDTLAGLINGQYTDTIKEFQVIDCRYPYEYEGGHIVGAVNLYTPGQILTMVERPLPPAQSPDRRILVFHCEFSLERGPFLSRFLRSSDRANNKDNYPWLHYPEIYLLHSGYRAFYMKHPELCTPVGYTAMMDPKHSDLLREYRSMRPPPAQGLRRNRLLM